MNKEKRRDWKKRKAYVKNWKLNHSSQVKKLNLDDYYRHHEDRKAERREYYYNNREKVLLQQIVSRYTENGFKCLERDSMTCQKCLKKLEIGKKEISIHHLNWNKKDNRLENLKLLCNSCHRKLHSYVKDSFDFSEEWIQKKTEEWFNPSRRDSNEKI